MGRVRPVPLPRRSRPQPPAHPALHPPAKVKATLRPWRRKLVMLKPRLRCYRLPRLPFTCDHLLFVLNRVVFLVNPEFGHVPLLFYFVLYCCSCLVFRLHSVFVIRPLYTHFSGTRRRSGPICSQDRCRVWFGPIIELV